MEEAVGLKWYTDGGGVVTSRVNRRTSEVVTFTPPQNKEQERRLLVALGEAEVEADAKEDSPNPE